MSAEDLDLDLVRPPDQYTWRRLSFWPVTAGSRILFRQCWDPQDSGLSLAFIFLFVHLKRGELDPDGRPSPALDREKHVIPLAWRSRAEFRSAMLRWIDTLGELGDADLCAMLDLKTRMEADSKRGAIEVAPGLTKKKAEMKSRPRK